MDNQEKRGKGRPRKTMEALVSRGVVPSTWKEDIIEMGRIGKNKLHFCNYLGINRDLMYRIIDRDPDFSSTIKYALELSEEWWVERLRRGFERETSQKVNGTLWKYYMQNVYRDSGWVDRTDITTDNKPLTNDNNIQIEIIKPKEDDENTSDNN